MEKVVHNLFITWSSLAPDLFMIYSWLVHLLFTAFLQLFFYKLLTTCLWLVFYLFTTFSQFLTCSLLFHNFFTIFPQLIHDLFMTCSLLVYNFFTTYSWLGHDFFELLLVKRLVPNLFIHLIMTCSQLFQDLLMNLFMFINCSWHVYDLYISC